MRPARAFSAKFAIATAFAFTMFATFAAQPAGAHPLGNFTINHLARITGTGSGLRVHYVLDIAEIPTFQIMQDAGGKWTPAASAAWAQSEIPRVQRGLQITVDGASAPLQPAGSPHERLRPGAGGLPILYWTADFRVPASAGAAHKITVSDSTYSDRRIGWKDIVAGAQTEPTHELLVYPSALIGTPRRVTSATFTLASSGAISRIVDSEDLRPQIASSAPWLFNPAILSGMFSRRNQTPLWIALTMLAAFGLGALHAVEPGHGKALLAFTLVGARATSKQALILAVSLTLAHTVSVLILGLVLLSATSFVSESVFPWITLIAGVAVAIIGARTLGRFIASRRRSQPHEHGHSHAVPGTQPLKFSNAIWAALSGGIAPCPAAIVVMLTALRLHQLGYGLVLIVVFSMGLATVLSGLGIGVVHGAAWLSKRSGYARISSFSPLITSGVISVIGAVMVGQGFVQLGFASSVLIVTLLVLVAIAGFALSKRAPASHQSMRPQRQLDAPMESLP